MNQALLLQAEGHFRQAWEELSTALQQDKSYVPALEARAIISLQMNNIFGALLDISAAIEVTLHREREREHNELHCYSSRYVDSTGITSYM